MSVHDQRFELIHAFDKMGIIEIEFNSRTGGQRSEYILEGNNVILGCGTGLDSFWTEFVFDDNGTFIRFFNGK